MGRRRRLAGPEPETITLLLDTDEEPPPDDGGEPEPIDGPAFALRWTDRELLRAKDFAAAAPPSSTRPTG